MNRGSGRAGIYALLLLASTIPVANGSAVSKQAELDLLRTRIARVQSNLERDIQHRSNVQRILRTTERRAASLTISLQTIDHSVAEARLRLATLRAEQIHEQAGLDAQKQALAKQIRAAYMEGQDSQLQLLLNARDPATISRLLVYYDYLNRARAVRIQAVRNRLNVLSQINARVQQQVNTLTSLRDQRARAIASLQRTRAVRRQVLAKLNTAIHTRGAKLALMRSDERSIENLLMSLRKTLAGIPANLEGHHRFVALRGRLPWPVAGQLIERFGQPLASGRLHAEGDLIAAPMGTPVHAVSYGRVVFADWLPHFGLLVIIDHGDGYMSIYAHNQSIYVRVGDWVHQGETIATLGDSGGQNRSALYFEIRHRNVALSPQLWCRGQLPHA